MNTLSALRPWSRDDLLTPSEAADRLRGRTPRKIVVAKLKEAGLIRAGPLGERVRWGDVLASYGPEPAVDATTGPPRPADVTGLRRTAL